MNYIVYSERKHAPLSGIFRDDDHDEQKQEVLISIFTTITQYLQMIAMKEDKQINQQVNE